MESALIVITLVSLAMTLAFGIVLARLMRDERRRSAARVAVLREMADAAAREEQSFVAAEPELKAPVMAIDDLTLAREDAIQMPADLFARPESRSAWPGRLAIAAAIVLVVAASAIALRQRSTPAETADRVQPRAAAAQAAGLLELLSLKQSQEANALTITGLVQNPRDGAVLAKVSATALAFGPDGTFLASGRAALDFTVLRPGDESGFVISVPVTTPVARYRIGFRSEDGRVIGHIDRRTAATMASRRQPVPVAPRGNIMSWRTVTAFVAVVSAFWAVLVAAPTGQESQDKQVFRFRTGVELINVTATVTDANGRFVSGLRKEDFRVFEDGQEQQVTHFNSERVPVSMGLVVDTSGSMEGEKWTSARQALNRFLFQLLDRDDEVFLYRFDNQPELIETWTTDRERIATGLARIRPRGATSLYDAVASAVPLAQTGRHRKKAIVVISDGNDTNSRATIREIKTMIRSTEVLACNRYRYAGVVDVGLGRSGATIVVPAAAGSTAADPDAVSDTGAHEPAGATAPLSADAAASGSGTSRGRPDDRLNVAALRDITDESGGRTEIVRYARDVDPATSSVADELSQQYLGYSSQGRKDGQWHTIRVELRDGRHLVRARKGYVALP